MSNESGKKKFQVPIWEKSNLTIEEAAEYLSLIHISEPTRH